MLTVKLMSLDAPFRLLSQHECEDMPAVRATVAAHAERGGFSAVREVPDADSIRFTARTPGGRHGRNIAYLDLYF